MKNIFAKDKTQEVYMTTEDVCSLLRFNNVQSARRFLLKNGVKAVRIGYKKILFKRADISRFLEERGA